jgi:hypothetical protein
MMKGWRSSGQTMGTPVQMLLRAGERTQQGLQAYDVNMSKELEQK